MKVVVTGASGLLGRAVCARVAADGHTVLGTALSRATADSGLLKLDLTDFVALQAFLTREKPNAIIHTAAERRPDVVERSPEASQILNVDVPSRIAAWCKAAQSEQYAPLLINISTDYVFDGVKPPFTVDDAPNPLNAYGRSKWEGEKGVLENGQAGRIANLRVPVLYGKTITNDESAVNILLDAVAVGSGAKPKKMDANAVRYPTNVDDIGRVLSQLCSAFAGQGSSDKAKTSIPPTIHFSAREALTKYDMCLVMARCLRAVGEEAETDHLVAEYEVDPSAATSRPRHCKLDQSVIEAIEGVTTDCISFESWWREYLEEYAVQARQRRAREAAELEAQRKREEEERRRLEEERLERERKEEEERQRNEAERRAAEEQETKEKAKAEEERRKLEEVELARKQEEEAIQRRRAEEEAVATTRAEETQQGQKQSQDGVAGTRSTADTTADDDNVNTSTGPSSAAPNVARSSSSTGQASLRSPNSPNPSFSSLRARPTPPATSGRSSPSPSLLSMGGGSAQIAETVREEDDTPGVEEATASVSTSRTEAEAARGTFDPLNPSAAGRAQGVHLRDDSRATAIATEDNKGFFPSALVEAGDGSSLGIDQPRALREGEAQSVDSDGYGLPSPRGAPPAGTPFAAGYGEVPYGADSAAPAEQATGKGSEAAQPAGQQAGIAVTDSASKTGDSKAIHRPTFHIRVGDPQKVGDPVTAHIVYTVRIKTDSPHFRAAQFSVLRRYSDFRWLHAALVHGNPGIFVPPVPEKVKIGRFAPDLVEARRHGLESCVNKIANNPALQDDEDLRLFLDSANFAADVKARDQIKGPVPTPEQKTYFGWSTSLTGTTYRFVETDGWFDEQKVYLDHLEMQLKTLVRVVSALAQQRKEVAAATSEMSHALMMLSGSSLSRALSTCFAGLGEVERRTFELADMQADADVREYGSVLYEYERMVGSARKAFATRIDAWQTWQRLEEECKKVRVKHEKVKRDSQPGSYRAHDGRLQAVLDELATIETRCLNAKREFDVVGRRCKEQMDAFEWDRIRAFHEAAEAWLQGMIERSTEIMSEWEQYAALLERQTGHSIQAASTASAAE